MKILLTGKNGQVGFELQRSLALLGEVHAVGSVDCDFADGQAVQNLVDSVRPDVIVNAAAYTAVDRAESEPHLAHAINAVAPRIMGEAAQRIGAAVVHFSTDYVFDGEQHGKAYVETDITRPLSVYGRSKLDGEEGLKHATPHHLIFRASWVVGSHGRNFAKSILQKAEHADEIKVVADQYGAPTSAALISDVTAHAVKQLITDGVAHFPFGLYHLSASGVTNWHAYAQFLVEEAQRAGRVLKVRSEHILPIPASSYPTAAKRPSNSRLNTSQLQTAFGLRLPPWEDGVRHILQQIL